MKALTLLPRDIKRKYDIERTDDTIHLYTFGYINIDIDDEFTISETESCWNIKNSKVIVSLWKGRNIRHITVY